MSEKRFKRVSLSFSPSELERFGQFAGEGVEIAVRMREVILEALGDVPRERKYFDQLYDAVVKAMVFLHTVPCVGMEPEAVMAKLIESIYPKQEG